VFGGTYGYGTVFQLSPKSGKERVLYNLGNGTDGSEPLAGLISDALGNFYSTTSQGGANGYGTVFEVAH